MVFKTFAICSSILLILLTIILFKYHINIITFPYPLEFREGVSIQTTKTLLNGDNPYAFVNQPRDTNVYGILYSIVCYPFAKIFSPSLQLHRTVSGIFILLSSLIVFLFARLKKHPGLPSFTISVIFYASLLYFVSPLVRPDSLGLFFFLLALYIPFRYSYSSNSLLVSGFIGILACFAKTFFMLIYPFLGSYLFLFVSKKKGIAYSLFSCIILIILAVVLNIFQETYIRNTFFNNINAAGYDVHHLMRQLFFGVKSYAFISIIFVFGMFSLLTEKYKQKTLMADICLSNAQSTFVDVRHFARPFLMLDIECTAYYLVCAVVLFCLSLGGHRGAWMTYFYQLISPFFLIILLDVAQHLKDSRNYSYLILAGILNISLFYVTILPHYTVLQVRSQWEEIYELVSRNETIFNSPAIASVLQEKNKPVYDSGQSEYFRISVLPKKLSFLSRCCYFDGKILKREEQYRKEIEGKVKNQKFDLIITTQNYPHYSFIDKSLLPKYYDKKNTLSAPMPHTGQNWVLEIWTRT
jgi:hypothetical protein